MYTYHSTDTLSNFQTILGSHFHQMQVWDCRMFDIWEYYYDNNKGTIHPMNPIHHVL
jgi:hypothetical protein